MLANVNLGDGQPAIFLAFSNLLTEMDKNVFFRGTRPQDKERNRDSFLPPYPEEAASTPLHTVLSQCYTRSRGQSTRPLPPNPAFPN